MNPLRINKRYYESTLSILLVLLYIVLPVCQLAITDTVHAKNSDTPLILYNTTWNNTSTEESSPQMIAPCFSYPVEDSWTLLLGFGEKTEAGLYLCEDILLPENTPVYSAANGVVKFTGHTEYFGNSVIIEHFTGTESVCTVYGHLNFDNELTVNLEQAVTQGQIIGHAAAPADAAMNSGTSHLLFGIRKGEYKNYLSFITYDPPGDIVEWYAPAEFIDRHTCPPDKSLVSLSDSPYQDRIYWLQNGKLYIVAEKIDDTCSWNILDEMSILPGWNMDTIDEFSSLCLSTFNGWPDGEAEFITTGKASNGLLICEEESPDIYLIIEGEKICFPDTLSLENSGYCIKDVISVTEKISNYFEIAIDDATLVNEVNAVEVYPGQPFIIDFNLRNSGTSTWNNKLHYKLGPLTGFDAFLNESQIESIVWSISDNITPGDIWQCTINDVVAPTIPGIYELEFRMKRGDYSWFGDILNLRVIVNEPNAPPEKPSAPSGPDKGIINIDYSYKTMSADPENDKIKYIIDWGDGNITESDFVTCNNPISQAHIWHDPGIYYIKVKAIDSCWNNSDWSESTPVVIDALTNSPPDTPSSASGPGTGYVNIPYTYATTGTDPDTNRMKYIFDWNDDSVTETGYINSDSIATATHTWKYPGTYSIKVMAMDNQSAISTWSSNKEVVIYAQPTVPSIPEGPDTGFTGTSYEYSTIARNLNDTRTKYIFDWGDDTHTEIEHTDPDSPVTAQHIWEEPGTYEIKARVITGTMTSEWSEPKYVTIFTTSSPTPSTPTLISPSDNDIVSGTSITFNWSKSIEATKYVLEVNSSVTWADAGRIYYVNLSTNEITLNDFPNNGTTYYWRVRAGNDKNWSSWSSINTFLNINQPSKPTLTSPGNNDVLSTSTVTYKWSETKGADRYLLEVNTQPTWTAATRKLYLIVGNITEYNDSGYTFRDTTYYWRVRAGNDSEWSEWSTYNQFTQAAPLLTSPVDSGQVDGSAITFAWTAVNGITGYTLEINSDPNWDPYYSKFYQYVGNVKEYEVTGFEQDGTRYYWRVRCGDMTNWIYSSETRSFTNTSIQAPSKPTITSPEDSKTVSGKSVTYKWNTATKANEYFLEVNSDPNWNSKKWKLQKNVGDVTEYTDDGYLNDGTFYYWRVRAGNEAGWSEPSESFSFINFSLSPPVLSEPKDEEIVSGKSLVFKWKGVKGAEYYLLEVNSSETWNPKSRHFYKIVDNVTTYTVPDFLNDGTDYYWRVKVSNGSHWSTWSEPFSVTNGLAGTPSAPGLTSPAENASVAGNTVTYKWSTVSNANQYWLEVNTDPVTWSRKTRKFFGNVGNVQEYKDIGYSNDGTVYYWRVRAGNDVDWSTFSIVQYFTNWN